MKTKKKITTKPAKLNKVERGNVIIPTTKGVAKAKELLLKKSKASSEKPYTMSSAMISPEEIVKVVKGKKGAWSIYKNTRVFTNYKPDGTVKGRRKKTETFGTRLTAKNGNILCGNTGFDTLQSALKNIRAVQASA